MAGRGTQAQAWTTALVKRAGGRLRPDDQAALESLACCRRHLRPDQHVAREGDVPTHCALIETGTLYQTKLTQDGARQIVGLRLQDEFVGLSGLLLHHADHDIQALTPCTLIEIPLADLRPIVAARPTLGQILLTDALVSCSIAQDWILTVGRRDARCRVAHLLCELALRIEGAALGAGASFRLPLNQRQFGDAVGLGRVAVNRVLHTLIEEGVIALDKSRVTIIDPRRLEAAGDFSARYLHLGQSARDRRGTDRNAAGAPGAFARRPEQPATEQPAASQAAIRPPAISQPAIAQPAISQPTAQPAAHAIRQIAT